MICLRPRHTLSLLLSKDLKVATYQVNGINDHFIISSQDHKPPASPRDDLAHWKRIVQFIIISYHSITHLVKLCEINIF